MPLTLRRVDDWPERLAAVVDDHRAQPFKWGAYDCATFFGDAVERITQFDPFAAYWPWSSERDAMRKLVDGGYRDMLAFCRHLFPEIPPSKAGRGDVGFTGQRTLLSSPAVITGAEAMSRDDRGWIVVPTTLLVCAFKVG